MAQNVNIKGLRETSNVIVPPAIAGPDAFRRM